MDIDHFPVEILCDPGGPSVIDLARIEDFEDDRIADVARVLEVRKYLIEGDAIVLPSGLAWATRGWDNRPWWAGLGQGSS